MPRAVRFHEHGPLDVLHLEDVEPPEPQAGEVRVRVIAAGLNPVDYKIVESDAARRRFGVGPLPQGNGNDFSGVVDRVGAGVTDLREGDEVFGGARMWAQADYLVSTPARLALKPAALTHVEAGVLDIAGRTAWASVESLALSAADTVLVSAAAGGVGVLASQLALRHGATVIGTASVENHDYLRGLGVIPVTYGPGLVDRVRAAAPDGVTAVLDNNGPETIEAGLELGVLASCINTIAARPYVASHGVADVGGQQAGIDELRALADLVATGEVQVPIHSTFPLEEVVEAYRRLKDGHLRGKIALTLT